jgi:hypothetical protein
MVKYTYVALKEEQNSQDNKILVNKESIIDNEKKIVILEVKVQDLRSKK